ncbi:carboxypeptidase-like regulatory domain-containing protein [uncultured Gimesia sp.]|uniref:carboxypeptidase-like regulatory domain-containing protein n=1 Tax=uncultured Gimesia sp. TaxID=1678688 RepID=UPI0030DDC2BE
MNQPTPVSPCASTRNREWAGRQWLVLCSVFLLGMLLTPFAVRAAENSKEKQLTIKGTVVDAQNKPVANAKVFIDARDRYEVGLKNLETRTDTQGKFTLTGNTYWILGQTLQAKDSDRLMAQLYLSLLKHKQPDLNHLRLQLKPPRRVELEVVDGTGKPVADAKTGIMAQTKVWGIGTTDTQGKIAFQIPHDVEIKYAVALSDGHGTDYKAYTLNPEDEYDPQATPPKFPDHPVRLTLEGTQPLKVKIQSTERKPIAGIRLAPWNLNKPDQPRTLNLAAVFYVSKVLEQTTDAEGTTVFNWIPHWQKQRIILVHENEEYAHRRIVYDPAKSNGTLTIQLKPKDFPADKVDAP